MNSHLYSSGSLNATLNSHRQVVTPGTGVSDYRAPRWLPGGHAQTLYAYFLKQTPAFQYRRERWEIPDGDFIDLDWLDYPAGASPLVVLFHGLEGCSRSQYSVSLMNELRIRGWHGIVPHFRGCSGEINRLHRVYHSGDSAEIDWILRRLKTRYPASGIYAVGISIGGNMLLKWLGEQGERASKLVEKAAAVSTPLDLQVAAQVLDRGWNRLIYTSSFLKCMKQRILQKINTHGLQLDPKAVRRASTFRAIDELYTAPVHGFLDAEDYWRRASSKPWLAQIEVPTLLINARNDPFFSPDALPRAQEVSDAVALEFPDSGGHLGFVSGRFPGHLGWLPRRILKFFAPAETASWHDHAMKKN